MTRYSTREAAKKLGIHFVTMQRYIAAKKIPAPESERIGRGIVRAWTDEDIERVRRVLPTIANGRKTRYQKVRQKQKAQPTKAVPRKKRSSKKPKPASG
jgi:predicted DNA-binding transcriptional regulator AlpA